MQSEPTSDNDTALLRRFAENKDEAAFREIVERNAGLVYGVALRRTGNPANAEEVTQTVFIVLARKAKSLGNQRSVAAWLHRATTLESLKSLRGDSTRQRHLNMIRDNLTEPQGSAGDEQLWRDFRPQIDQLLDKLSATDRDIVMMHYFEDLSFQEIAERTGTTAEAARKRGARALEKLSGLLKKRGIQVSSALLTTGLAAELATAAPAGLVTKAGTAALTSLSTASTLSASITAMTASKVTFAAAFLVAASVPVGVQMLANANTDAEQESQPAPASVKPASSVSSARAGTGSAPAKNFDPEGFRAALHKLQEKGGAVDRAAIRQLQRYVFTLEPVEVQDAVAVLEEFEEPANLQEVISSAFARWAELDPGAAIENAVSRPPKRWGYYPLTSAWQTWAFFDWDSALEWSTSTDSGYDHQFLYWGHLDNMGEIDGERGVEQAVELGIVEPGRRQAFLSRALSALGKQGPAKAIQWMDENLTEYVERDAVAGDALEGIGNRHPAVALDHVTLIDNPERLREVRYNIYWQWVLNQPAAAADYLEQSLAAGTDWSASTLLSAGNGLARNNPERALEIARSITDPKHQDEFYCGILCGARDSDYALVLEAADAISEEMSRTNNSLGGFLEDWAKRDRAAAKAWVDALPEGKKKKWARHAFPRK